MAKDLKPKGLEQNISRTEEPIAPKSKCVKQCKAERKGPKQTAQQLGNLSQNGFTTLSLKPPSICLTDNNVLPVGWKEVAHYCMRKYYTSYRIALTKERYE